MMSSHMYGDEFIAACIMFPRLANNIVIATNLFNTDKKWFFKYLPCRSAKIGYITKIFTRDTI